MLPAQANVTATIYRGFDATNPYPIDGTEPVASVPGLLKHHLKNGIRGRATGLFWTHLLYLDDSVDIREAYDAQLNTEDPTQADTILIGDYPLTKNCCAFYVVHIQRIPEKRLLRVYLDRMQRKGSVCPSTSIVTVCCPHISLPPKLTLAWGASVAPLQWDKDNLWWAGTGTQLGHTYNWRFGCFAIPGPVSFKVWYRDETYTPGGYCLINLSSATLQCKPFHWTGSGDGCPTWFSGNAAFDLDVRE